MTLLIFILAYLIGSIPTALFVGRMFFHIDIREHGSYNPGATNTLRVLGKRAALAVLFVDVGKGALAASIACSISNGSFPSLPRFGGCYGSLLSYLCWL